MILLPNRILNTCHANPMHTAMTCTQGIGLMQAGSRLPDNDLSLQAQTAFNR